MKKVIAVILVSLATLTACGSPGGKVTTLSSNEFASKIAEPAIVLLDVRTPGEFASGHIGGATNVDFESGTFESDINKLDKTKVYAVYCRSGNRSGQATALMVKNGFKTVFNLDGGIVNCQAAGEVLVTN